MLTELSASVVTEVVSSNLQVVPTFVYCQRRRQHVSACHAACLAAVESDLSLLDLSYGGVSMETGLHCTAVV